MADFKQELREALRRSLLQRLADRDLPRELVDEERLGEIASELDASLDQMVARQEEILQAVSEQAPPEALEKAVEKEEYFSRLSLNLRLQHVIMLTSVLILIVTGLPLKFHDAKFSHFIMEFFGGISNSAIIHRVGATGLIFVGVYHLLYTVLAKAGRRDFVLLLPKLQDLKDYIQQIKYFLGRTNKKAKFGRFSYIEKFDYWAVYWGMVIMIGSGSLLWFENIALRVLPKFILDIAKEAHSDEALLATLAIIIWHFYNVHLNPHKFPMSKIWITGKISKHEMLEEHYLEYEEILRQRAGDSQPKTQADKAQS
jgi:cytochrome b subunit of formate dehydrogenase